MAVQGPSPDSLNPNLEALGGSIRNDYQQFREATEHNDTEKAHQLSLKILGTYEKVIEDQAGSDMEIKSNSTFKENLNYLMDKLEKRELEPKIVQSLVNSVVSDLEVLSIKKNPERYALIMKDPKVQELLQTREKLNELVKNTTEPTDLDVLTDLLLMLSKQIGKTVKELNTIHEANDDFVASLSDQMSRLLDKIKFNLGQPQG